MFRRLFKTRGPHNRNVTEVLYAEIMAAARQPAFFSDWGVPDTPLGRFEMLSLHMFLFLYRAKDGGAALRAMARDVTDTFFTDVDHSLRELGIGDLGVPKRMKKLAQMFYGRADSYGKALDARDNVALNDALRRNVRPDLESWPGAAQLSAYVVSASMAIGDLEEDALLRGEIAFGGASGIAGSIQG